MAKISSLKATETTMYRLM